MLAVRPETIDDIPWVRVLNERAFEQAVEADIVDRLRQACPETLSFVAEDEGRVIGHILFTPAVIGSGSKVIQGMALAPMAVLPERQREGIGTRLVKHGLRALQDRSCPFVIVLGHPGYYPRFGFEPASRHGITCQWEGVPDEAFMILIFDEIAMEGIAGVARYRAEFDEAI
jgi:putative acetyltransferase